MPRSDFLEGAPELAAWCVGQTAGVVRVVAATYGREADTDGESMVVIDLTLTDPPEDDETWPVDDTLALRRRVREKGWELLAADRLWVRLRSEHPEPVDAEDDPLDEEAC